MEMKCGETMWMKYKRQEGETPEEIGAERVEFGETKPGERLPDGFCDLPAHGERPGAGPRCPKHGGPERKEN